MSPDHSPLPESEVVETAPVVRIEIDADPTVSYASYQNAVPLAQSVRIHNGTDINHRQVLVRVSTEPAFTESLDFRFEQLAGGEERLITPLKFKFNHNYLSELTEAEHALIKIEVLAGGVSIAEHSQRTTILAYDQWGGTRSVPELLTAFSTPNNPHVDRLLAEAAERLLSTTEVRLDGYTSKNRQSVWTQCAAIYAAVAARGIQYSLPPAGFTSSGQKIRLPDRMLTGGVGTCLDFTMLLAGCLEQAGLNPVILLNEGHAWVGCWLINSTFANATTDDPLAVRKRIDSGELIAFETTGLSHRPALSMRLALEKGYAHLKDDAEKFTCAIDLRRARMQGVIPIPTKGASLLDEREIAGADIPVETAPLLPPLIGEPIRLDDDVIVETPEGRLGRWKSKLLDLTLRNRLLNFKPTKAMIELAIPEPGVLEDALYDNIEWKFRATPAIMSGSDPRSLALARATPGNDPRLQQAREAMSKHELLVVKEQSAMDAALNEIFLNVRTALEETGANTLYVAIGFLHWAEDPSAEKVYQAPLLLVPVTLNRASLRAGYSITRHDDETLVNPTLLQALRDKHGVVINGLEPPPSDGKGVDVERVFAIFREAVKQIPRWQVTPEVYLGIFSFAKHVMYVDLKNRAEVLRRNKVVAHLIDRKNNEIDIKDLRERRDLDDRYSPGELLTPMSADSYQLNAVRHANDGESYVLIGPPGTGKSQTITNIIGHFLGQQKSVLFVSEKMAALGVVERRLREIGLGPFCLQLHSSKAIKVEVIEQLHSTLKITQEHVPHEWDATVERIARLRNELNGVVSSLHRKSESGLSVRTSLDIVCRNKDLTPCKVARAESNPLTLAEIRALSELGTDLQAIAVQLMGEDRSGESLANYALIDVLATEWSHRFETEFVETAVALGKAAFALQQGLDKVLMLLDIRGLALQPHDIGHLVQLAGLLLRAREVPVALVEQPDPAAMQQQMDLAVQAGQRRAKVMNSLLSQFKPSIATVDADVLEAAWSAASISNVLVRFFKMRGVSRQVAQHTHTGKRPKPAEMVALLPALRSINREDREITAQEAGLKAALPNIYRAAETDWERVEQLAAWSRNLEHLLVQFVDFAQPDIHRQLTQRAHSLSGRDRALIAVGSPGEAVLLDLQRLHSDYADKLVLMRTLSGNTELAAKSAPGGVLSQLHLTLSGWVRSRVQLREWCQFQLQLTKLTPLGFADAGIQLMAGGVKPSRISDYLSLSHHLWWVKGAMDRDETLRTFSSALHDQRIATFNAADQQHERLTRLLISARLSGRAAALAGKQHLKTEIGTLAREAAKQKRHLPIRKLVRGIPNLLQGLKPCMLMSPLSVANYLDPEHTQFDVVIFDEASQIPVWDAVGAIARGKQVIVVGDPKQLPPTAFFGAVDDESEGISAGPDDFTPQEDLESILSECAATGMSNLELCWHYRSRYESLIAFSNANYYGSNLVTFPSPVTKDQAVMLRQVNGIYDRGGSQTNRAEAEAVVARIIQHFQREDHSTNKQTLGVVTFNQKQMRLIDDLLAAELGKLPDVQTRMAEHGDERPFIKNLENVQGDERDLILFSTTFGKDKTGKSSMNFGPINNTGGERRLNVAITRARHGVEIFTSLRPEDIDLSKTRSVGVAHLKAYLDFAGRGPVALVSASTPSGRGVDSPLEQEIMDAIVTAGWEVHTQVGCAGYRIDLGVVDKAAPGSYLLGVECDGATYHSFATARDRDRLRQSVLEGLGWQLARVWSTEWWMNRARCTEQLVKTLKVAQERADKARAPAL